MTVIDYNLLFHGQPDDSRAGARGQGKMVDKPQRPLSSQPGNRRQIGIAAGRIRIGVIGEHDLEQLPAVGSRQDARGLMSS
jgi:hypothetical protein